MLTGSTGVTTVLANFKVTKTSRPAAERSELVGFLQERREEHDPPSAASTALPCGLRMGPPKIEQSDLRRAYLATPGDFSSPCPAPSSAGPSLASGRTLSPPAY